MADRSRPTRRAVLQGAGALALGAPMVGRAAAAISRPPGAHHGAVRGRRAERPDGPADERQVREALGQTFIVENRGGAGSNLGTAAVARSAPDGYTLLVTSSAFVVNPGLYKQVPYDPVKDFAPVAELDTSPNVFIATPASGLTSMAELVARAKEKPEALNYASAGVGTTPHLAGRAVEDRGRHQHDACAVSGRRSGIAGHPVRHGSDRVRVAAGRASQHPERRCARSPSPVRSAGTTCPTCRPCWSWL